MISVRSWMLAADNLWEQLKVNHDLFFKKNGVEAFFNMEAQNIKENDSIFSKPHITKDTFTYALRRVARLD